MLDIKKIAVFCWSKLWNNILYKDTAKRVGKLLAQNKISLVYWGWDNWLMWVVAHTILDEGWSVQWVTTKDLIDCIPSATRIPLSIHEDMHARKKVMYEISDWFIILPWSVWTLEEFFEIYTRLQLGYHEKPIWILNIEWYYDHLLLLLKNIISKWFMKKDHKEMLIIEDDPVILLEKMQLYTHQKISKW